MALLTDKSTGLLKKNCTVGFDTTDEFPVCVVQLSAKNKSRIFLRLVEQLDSYWIKDSFPNQDVFPWNIFSFIVIVMLQM